jgi:hypothetical protein
MTTKEKTLNHLRHLEALYRRGYRSDVVDRSLDHGFLIKKRLDFQGDRG